MMLEVRDLRVAFRDDAGAEIEAVRGISFSLGAGESLAIVGESGSGKSVTALALTRLLPEPPARIAGGSVELDGFGDLLAAPPSVLRRVRGAEIAYIFQEPGAALNPVFSIRTQIAEGIRLHRPDVRDVDAEIVSWLDRVGIVNAQSRLHAYPHELSGGMQQRVMIAMALACRPRILIADEPTTALDVTIQRRIIDLLADLRRELGMSVILITHNFGIIRKVADHVAVMFRGKIVEAGPVEQVLASPQHPYTRALIACIPRIGSKAARLVTIDPAVLAAE